MINKTQSSFSGGLISTELFSRLDYTKVQTGLKRCENFVVRPGGGVEYRQGTSFVSESSSHHKLVSFVYNYNDGLCLEFGEKYENGFIKFYKDGMPIYNEDGSVYQISTPYKSYDLEDIKYVQKTDSLYLVHGNYAPRKLTRISDNNWTIESLVLNPNSLQVSNLSIKSETASSPETIVSFDKWQYAVSVVDSDDKEYLPVYSNVISNDIDLSNQPIKVSFNKASGSVKKYNIYRVKGGRFCLVYTLNHSASSSTYSIIDSNFNVDESTTVKEYFDDFDGGNYPTCISSHNQRLVLASTNKEPNKIWFSAVGSFDDFTKTAVTNEANSFSLELDSNTSDTITDLISMDDLILFTEGAVWRVTGTSSLNMQANIESYTGSSGISPSASKKSILFIDNSLSSISNFIYSYELNGYSGQNLDILARDFFDGYAFSSISLRTTPYPVLYCIRNDGAIMSLTYLKEENIYAWSLQNTDGLFKSVCTVNKKMNDQVYCIVERNNVAYLEMFQKTINNQDSFIDSWHLDCATKYLSDWHKYENIQYITKSTKYNAYRMGLKRDWNCFKYLYTSAEDFRAYSVSKNIHIGDNVKLCPQALPHSFTLVEQTEYLPLQRDRPFNGTDEEYVAFFNPPDFDNNVSGYLEDEDGDLIYITHEIMGSSYFIKDKDGDFVKKGNIDDFSEDKISIDGVVYFKDISQDVSVVEQNEIITYKYTHNLGVAGGLCYDTPTGVGSHTIDSLGVGGSLFVDGIIYNYVSPVGGKIEFTNLERFNNRTVTAIIDGNIYENLNVLNGILDLSGIETIAEEIAVALVGLPYQGLIETIPFENYNSKTGEYTFGVNRGIRSGVLNYKKTRGLWYGISEDKLFEIRPYTNENFGEPLVLETGNLSLRVADGFKQDSSFLVVQKSPFPAFIKNITLGIDYGNRT